MQVKRIEKIDMPAIIAEELVKLIVNGNYESGEKLPPSADLAKDMGVGYTTLREALKKLETLNFIEIAQGKGIFVKDSHPNLFMVNPARRSSDIGRKVLLDMLYVRKILECAAVKLASRKATKQNIKRIEKILENMKENIEDTNRFIRYNVDFHVAIAQSSKNTILAELLTTITRLITSEQEMSIPKIPRAKEKGYQYHDQIYKALRNGNDAKAVHYMSEHLEQIRRDIEKVCQSNNIPTERRRKYPPNRERDGNRAVDREREF